MIPFNQPYLTGKENAYILEAVANKKLSGNGEFTKKCHSFFEQRYNFSKCLLTTSCTDALEMAAILIDVGPGDEVIVPSYTFVSSANAFILRGAKIIFADSLPNHPNIDHHKLEALITPKTKAIVVVHYAGVACEMDHIMHLAEKHNLFVVEDAAQAIDGYYKGRPLGGIGHLAAFSFHETKNIISGEGGMLVVNDKRFLKRSEIIWEKGTNRSAFFRGEVNKYEWVDLGSSFLPSEVTAAFLYAQLENLDDIQQKRINIWNKYYNKLKFLAEKGLVGIPEIHDLCSNNAHMFYLLTKNLDHRSSYINYMKSNGIHTVFHYLALEKSSFYKKHYEGIKLPESHHYENNIVRLPLFYELTEEQQDLIINKTIKFFLDHI